LLCGGVGRPGGYEKGYFAKPTVFADVSNDMTIARQEIFGPVLSLIPYEGDEEAVAIGNDTPYVYRFLPDSGHRNIVNFKAVYSGLTANCGTINLRHPYQKTCPFHFLLLLYPHSTCQFKRTTHF
jgi:acyl-CoA reductase-like NAD-dependent aldehyde dehydrogenase